MSQKPLCIWHGACDDGFTSAWIVRSVLGAEEVDFYAGVYQKDPPDVTGRDVFMVDFSYKRPVIEKMLETCRSLTILDHHKTAMEDLSNLGRMPISWHERRQQLEALNQADKVAVLFDMTRSGAGITRDFFYDTAHGGHADPHVSHFVDYIQDRDLWTKAYPEGDQFTIALRSYPQDFDVWNGLIFRKGVAGLIEEGRHIWRYYRSACDQVLKEAYQAEIGFDGDAGDHEAFAGMFVNAPYFLASEVAGDLADTARQFYGAAYFRRADGQWQYSLRSCGDFDVANLARRFGGGGHAKAAGFAVSEPVHKSGL